MAYTTIDNPELYFQTKLYTGNGTAIGSGGQAITLDGDEDMAPDFVWIKNRVDAHGHQLYDTVRNVTKRLSSNNQGATSTDTEGLTTFGSDGFTLGNDEAVNKNTETYVAWCWKAGGSASSNSNGTITSSVSVNTTAGFSIATYTGNNSNAQTIGHGLGVAPKVYIIKRRDSSSAWGMYHGSLGTNKYLQVESTNPVATDTGIWNNTAPTSTVLSLGNAGYFNNASSGTYVCYAFSEKQGYSKVGSFEGNNNADGSFVYLGFKPKWVIIKDIDSQGTVGGSVATSWGIWDSARMPGNPAGNPLWANNAVSETVRGNGSSANTGGSDGNGLGGFIFIDMLSNGFKCRTGTAELNGSNTYVYMAFAEAPFVNSKGVPANAK